MPRLSGRHAMLEQLLAEGTKYVFGNPGTTEQAFIDALQDYPQIEYILALQEASAVGMADPPEMKRCKVDSRRLFCSICCSSDIQMVGTPALKVMRSPCSNS